MKILIDPMVAVLAKDLSTEEKAELLMCILEYPNRDSSLGLWKYMKQQIDFEAQKYREKCERAAMGRQRKLELKSTLISDLKSELKSAVRVEVSKDNIIKEKDNCNVRVSSNAAEIVNNHVENFLISGEFSFDNLCQQIPKFKDFLSTYPPYVVEKAQKTLIKKRTGQWLSITEIIDWLSQESIFYGQNHRG